MEAPSYRLQTPRRQPPPPLSLNNTTAFWRTSTASHRESQTLLYDLPSATISPPTSPQSVVTPTSPASAGRPQIRNGRPAPPGTRTRSQTPIGVAPNDLEKFAEQCRSWSGHLPFPKLSHSLLSGITVRTNKQDTRWHKLLLIYNLLIALLSPVYNHPFEKHTIVLWVLGDMLNSKHTSPSFNPEDLCLLISGRTHAARKHKKVKDIHTSYDRTWHCLPKNVMSIWNVLLITGAQWGYLGQSLSLKRKSTSNPNWRW